MAARHLSVEESVVAVEGDDAGDGVTFDELALASGGFAEGGGGDSVDVAKGAEGGLVDHGGGVGGEEVAVAAGLGSRMRKYSPVSSGGRASMVKRRWRRE